jgi:hypothetical protein
LEDTGKLSKKTMSIVSGFDMDGKENKTGLLGQFSQRFYYGCIGGIIVAIFLAIPLLKNNYLNHLITEMVFSIST